MNPDFYNKLHYGLGDNEEDLNNIEENDKKYELEREYRENKSFSNGFSFKQEKSKVKDNKGKQKVEEYQYSLLGLEKEFINATPD